MISHVSCPLCHMQLYRFRMIPYSTRTRQGPNADALGDRNTYRRGAISTKKRSSRPLTCFTTPDFQVPNTPERTTRDPKVTTCGTWRHARHRVCIRTAATWDALIPGTQCSGPPRHRMDSHISPGSGGGGGGGHVTIGGMIWYLVNCGGEKVSRVHTANRSKKKFFF